MADLLSTLKFVQGAVARKNLVPEMTHFIIEAGRITAFNGRLALSSPIDFNIDCLPKADTLIKAIGSAEGTVTLGMTPGGKLRVASDRTRVLVDCLDERTLQPVTPEGQVLQLEPTQAETLVSALGVVINFIGDDAARVWTNGALFTNQSIYATCNVIIVQRWLGFNLVETPINVPYEAIKEVLRVKEIPVAIQYNANSISFHFESGRWIRSQLLPAEWPDLDPILERPCTASPISEDVFKEVDKLKPFLGKVPKIIFSNGEVRTHDDVEEGAHSEVEMSNDGIYAFDMFMKLKGVATHADFSTWPNPCMFYGDGIRGAIIGRKL